MPSIEVAHPLWVRLGFLGSVDEIPAVLRTLGFEVLRMARPEPDAARSLDLLVVAGWGEVLAESVFGAPRLGTWNVHPSLLPNHRGADALRWAFLDGDERFGVSIHQMVRFVDAGPVLWSTTISRTPLDTHSRMLKTLMALAASALPTLLRTAPSAWHGELRPVPPARGRVPVALQRLDPHLDAITLHRRIAAFDDRAPSLSLAGRPIPFTQSVCIDTATAEPGRVLGVDGARIAVHAVRGTLLAVARDASHGVQKGDVLTACEGP